MPDGEAILTTFNMVDPDTGANTPVEYVVQYFGTYLVNPASGSGIKSPFSGNSEVPVDAEAAGSASSCATVCAELGFRLSENLAGDCMCGNEPNFPSLTDEPRSRADIPCPEDSAQICGGGVALVAPGDSYVDIIIAVPSSQAVIKFPDGTTATPSKFPHHIYEAR